MLYIIDPMQTSGCPVVYGAAHSVYVRAVRLTLWTKAVAYRLVEVDLFAPDGPPSHRLARHPFGRIPAFGHGPFKLYETAPVCRYIDEAFDGPALQPPTARERVVMGQAISILDNYAYRTPVWNIHVERVPRPARGIAPDLAKIEAALPRGFPRRINVCPFRAHAGRGKADGARPASRYVVGANTPPCRAGAYSRFQMRCER